MQCTDQTLFEFPSSPLLFLPIAHRKPVSLLSSFQASDLFFEPIVLLSQLFIVILKLSLSKVSVCSPLTTYNLCCLACPVIPLLSQSTRRRQSEIYCSTSCHCGLGALSCSERIDSCTVRSLPRNLKADSGLSGLRHQSGVASYGNRHRPQPTMHSQKRP